MSATTSTSPADHLACPHGGHHRRVRRAAGNGGHYRARLPGRELLAPAAARALAYFRQAEPEHGGQSEPSGPPLDDPKLGAICLLAADVSQWQRSRFY